MTDLSGEPVRIGNLERDEAVTALREHLDAGRLTPAEHSERTALAAHAHFLTDLTPLFEDLPAVHTAVAPPTVALPTVAPPATTSPTIHPPSDGEYVSASGRPALGGRFGAVAVAASPIVAVILFFVLNAAGWDNSWLVFLLIPLAGAVVYGGFGGSRARDRR